MPGEAVSFTWIPFFKEWHDKLVEFENKQAGLVQLLRDAKVNAGLTDQDAGGVEIPLSEIDPFTATNLLVKNGDKKLVEMCELIAQRLGMTTPVPKDFDGVPRPNPQNSWYFPYQHKRDPGHIPALWRLFHLGREGKVDSAAFDQVLKMPHVGLASLSQALFRLAPEHYLPLDSQTLPYLRKRSLGTEGRNFAEYSQTIAAIRAEVKSPFWQLSFDAWRDRQPEPQNRYSNELNAAAIRNGYIPVPRPGVIEARHYGGATDDQAGEKFMLGLPNGEKIMTDVRRSGQAGRIRARFGSLFKDMDVKEGDQYILERIDSGKYQLSFATDEIAPETQQQLVPHPLNQILYGPPGTGKTFVTKQLAVEICDGVVSSSRAHVLRRYAQLQAEGRVRFVTFHPSFSYEDFVEGIRLDRDSGRFEPKSGVFKELCGIARGSSVQAASVPSQLEKRPLYKMSLGNTLDARDDWLFDYCRENNCLLLGYGEGLNFSGCNDWEAISAKVRSEDPDRNPQDYTYSVTAANTFKNGLKEGDLVLVSDGNLKFRAVAEVTGENYSTFTGPDGWTYQRRNIRWVAVFNESLPISLISSKRLSQMTIYMIDPGAINWDALRELLSPMEQDDERKKYVLVIDEINRGNISKIFGELITLLEPDKRVPTDPLVASEFLEVTLPYSRDRFGIPDNLYVIGTMNTADRSISALDLALRRRFHFVECAPDPTAIRPKKIGNIDLGLLLTALNQRIEYLLDRDHLLGHAYLMGVQNLQDLQQVFVTKVIPLLQEYFFDDWAKIALVLKVSDRDNPFLHNSHALDPQELFGTNQHPGLRQPKQAFRVGSSASWEERHFQQLYAHLDDDKAVADDEAA